LGSDGYINNFFAVMRAAFLMHKARLQNPSVMPAERIWHMATEGGAAALGLANVGALRPGCHADLLLINGDLPTPITAHNLREQLILWRDPIHVQQVMAGGHWLEIPPPEGEQAKAIRIATRAQAKRLWGIH
jgi:5-methylthioadenosine/S-adenosylhomocysteine deaminase